MLSPKTGNPMREVEGDSATYTLRGQEFQVSGPAWECPDTGTRYFTPEQGNILMARLHHAWRERHGIAKEALRARRKALGLSAAQASALLGLGINQYRTYENTDKLPSKSNALLLRLLTDDRALPVLLDAAGDTLTPATRRKLKLHLEQVAHAVPATPRPTITSGHFDTSGGSLGQLSDMQPSGLQEAGDYTYAMAA
jgi:putative zinc finger/helix-turn-helix YgiT family protein